MKDKAKLDFSADRIFSTAETGQPKSDILKQLEHKHPNTSYHFVEDKLGTLDKVPKAPCIVCVKTIENCVPLSWPIAIHV